MSEACHHICTVIEKTKHVLELQARCKKKFE